MSDQRADVDGGLSAVHRGDICCERWIAEGLHSTEQVHRIGRLTAQTYGSRADAAIAHNDRGDALRKLWQHRGRADHTGVIMGVYVDKSGSQREALGVNGFQRVHL